MTEAVSLKQIHNDILALREDVNDLKECFHEDFLELTADTRKSVKQARQRMKKEFVSNEEMVLTKHY